jgi:adenine-specific DNA-methyltransferase
MHTDLMSGDLKKKQSGSQSFWLIGKPDVVLVKIEKGSDKGKYKIKVKGFDYYDVKNGIVESGGTDRIAMWMLDTDYDGMCIEPKQVFFPMEGKNEGWDKLAKTLKAEIDQDLIEKYRGIESLPFTPKENSSIAVKIVDDRGIECLKIIAFGGING